MASILDDRRVSAAQEAAQGIALRLKTNF